MNIYISKYIIFIPIFIWSLASMISSHDINTNFITLFYILNNIINIIEVWHDDFLNKKHINWTIYYQYITRQNIIQACCCIYNFNTWVILILPCLIIMFDPQKIALGSGLLWLCCFPISLFYDGIQIEWWGILLLLWALFRHMSYEYVNEIWKKKAHQLAWMTKFFEIIILYVLRWFTWCYMVFPHILRYDLTCFGLVVMFLILYMADIKYEQEKIVFKQSPKNNHFPAPDLKTAKKCEMCKECIHDPDEENQEDQIL